MEVCQDGERNEEAVRLEIDGGLLQFKQREKGSQLDLYIQATTIDSVDRVGPVETKTSFLKGTHEKRLVNFEMRRHFVDAKLDTEI